MRAYKGRRNILAKRVFTGIVVLAVVFIVGYLGVTKIIDIPFDKLFQKQEQKQVSVENNKNTNTLPAQSGNMIAAYIAFDQNSQKSASQQLSDFIAKLDKTYINTIGFDISYMQIGKNESKDFDIAALVKTASDAGFRTIMRVDTLSLPKTSDISWKYAVMTKNSVTWLDRNNNMWLNPYAADGTGEVIKQYCEAAKKYGFNVIELNRLGFFMEGRLELVSFGDNDSIQNRVAALNALVKIAKDDLKDSNVILGLSLDTLALLDPNKVSVGQNSSDMAASADVVIPYISVNDILANKDALASLGIDNKADASAVYQAVLNKLSSVDKSKTMPCIEITTQKNSALATKDFIKKATDSVTGQKLYGIEFSNTGGAYVFDNFKKQ